MFLFPIISFFLYLFYTIREFFFSSRPQKKPTLSFLFLNIFITGVSAFLVFFLSSERVGGWDDRKLQGLLAAAGTAWKRARV